MLTLSQATSDLLPADQQAIIDRCIHPSGQWEFFAEGWLERSLPARFEERVARFPHNLAVKIGPNQLTYAQLNQAANRVAHTLLVLRGETPEPIPLFFDYEIDFFVAMWGVLKAGKFYTPLDVTYPEERNRQILEDLQAPLLLTNRANLPLAQTTGLQQLEIFDIDEWGLAPTHNPALSISPDAYAYVVFTSGSTGRPKGVIIDHRDVMHFSRTSINHIHVCPEDRDGLTASFSFNGSAYAIYGTFLSGATLYPFPLKQRNAAEFTDWLAAEEITILVVNPSAFRQWAVTLPPGQNFPHLRYLRTGAEKLYVADWELYCSRFSDNCILRYALGTSEVKVAAHFHMTKENRFPAASIPVGYPLQDIEVLILGEDGQALPVNQAGQIAFRSRYMSPGYWRLPAVTAAKFLPDPDNPQIRTYLTGDIGVMHPDGCLYHLGRQDFQVKIRGYRVEVVEIEEALMEMNSLAQVVVDAQSDAHGEQRLVAWLAPHTWPPPTVSEVRRHLARKLPDYLIPQAYVFLPALPQTAAGKIDRQALPPVSRERPALAVAYTPPQTPNEEFLVRLWEDVLGLEQVGVHDPFLELGGDSLQAMRILATLNQRFQVQIPVQLLLQTPTIAAMALAVTQAQIEQMDMDAQEQLLADFENAASK